MELCLLLLHQKTRIQSNSGPFWAQFCANIWAAQNNACLLTKLMPKGKVFSVLFNEVQLNSSCTDRLMKSSTAGCTHVCINVMQGILASKLSSELICAKYHRLGEVGHAGEHGSRARNAGMYKWTCTTEWNKKITPLSLNSMRRQGLYRAAQACTTDTTARTCTAMHR